MFDNNPFREFKKMMKERNLKEEDHNMGMGTGAEADYDSAEEQKKLEKQISSRITDHQPPENPEDPTTTQRHLEYVNSADHIASNLGSDAVDTILDDIEQERDDSGHKPGTPFNPVHSQLIDHIMKRARGYDNIKHGRRISDMEHAPSSGSVFLLPKKHQLPPKQKSNK